MDAVSVPAICLNREVSKETTLKEVQGALEDSPTIPLGVHTRLTVMKCELREVVEARSRPWHSDREDADGRQRVQGKGVGSFGCATVEAFCNYNIHFPGGGVSALFPSRTSKAYLFNSLCEARLQLYQERFFRLRPQSEIGTVSPAVILQFTIVCRFSDRCHVSTQLASVWIWGWIT